HVLFLLQSAGGRSTMTLRSSKPTHIPREKQFTKGVEPMKFRIGEMTVGDILDRGLKLLFSRLGTFYTINLIVLLPVLAFQLAMPELGLASDEYKLLIGLGISL